MFAETSKRASFFSGAAGGETSGFQAGGIILTLLLPLFAKMYQEWIFMAEGSAYTNFLYYLTEFPMLGVTVLAVAGIVLGIWLLRQNSSRTHVRPGM